VRSIVLTGKFFPWPYPGVDLQQGKAELQGLFDRSALGVYSDPGLGGNLCEFVLYVCRLWNVNPWWVVVSGQREQSTFKTDPMAFTRSARVAWLGFVGQDVGRIVRPGYYGVYTQVERCVAQTAWMMGIEPDEKWPAYERRAKVVDRYYPGLIANIGGSVGVRTFHDMGEYVQLAYTPHLEVLETNMRIARDTVKVPPQYLDGMT
jgi:hypothetical protein